MLRFWQNKTLFSLATTKNCIWDPICLAKAPLYLVDPKYGANVWEISKPPGATLFRYVKIKFDPSRVIHQYTCNEPSSKIHKLIVARHDSIYYKEHALNLVTFMLFSKALVDEYVVDQFKQSKHLQKIKVIDDTEFNGFNAIGTTLDSNKLIANQQLMELISIINHLNGNIPKSLQDNLLKFNDFSCSDDILKNMYQLQEQIFYERPRVVYPEKSIEAKIKEKIYDEFSIPEYLPPIFKYIIKPELTVDEYGKLRCLLEKDPTLALTKDPAGCMAHQLAARICSKDVLWLFYTALSKLLLNDDRSKHVHDWYMHYKLYFDGNDYSYAKEYRIENKMDECRKAYLHKIHEYSTNISETEYKHAYPNLKNPKDQDCLQNEEYIRNLHFGILQGHVIDLQQELSQVIDNNNLIKFKSILFYLQCLPVKDNGTFLEYILRSKKISKQMLEMFFSYYYHVHNQLLPEGPYNKNTDPELIKMIIDYNSQVEAKQLKALRFPKFKNVELDVRCGLMQYYIDNHNNILLVQKPIYLLNDQEKQAMYCCFANNFRMLNQDSDPARREYFYNQLSVKNIDNLELVSLFYNSNNELMAFLTAVIHSSCHQFVGDFILIHAKIACNNPKYAGFNLINLALGQLLLLSERVTNIDSQIYVFFKSIPPGYAVSMMPFYIDFFPKNYIPYHLLQHIVQLAEDHLNQNGMSCKLKVARERINQDKDLAYKFYEYTIGKGIENAMPVIFSMNQKNSSAYLKVLKSYGITRDDIMIDIAPNYLKFKTLNSDAKKIIKQQDLKAKL